LQVVITPPLSFLEETKCLNFTTDYWSQLVEEYELAIKRHKTLFIAIRMDAITWYPWDLLTKQQSFSNTNIQYCSS